MEESDEPAGEFCFDRRRAAKSSSPTKSLIADMLSSNGIMDSSAHRIN